ncbi:hypothetical protein B0T10DRAFT_134261 [Thelonectria olida]|uniref:Uncharacterized protein n=1 Tax=Thelonectria olida TaxID=1576542 RepID=A0A9P8VX58_9HYPO|nr:hypothetical protein B0T10DRAFT_134261 [Thelonectria olida]
MGTRDSRDNAKPPFNTTFTQKACFASILPTEYPRLPAPPSPTVSRIPRFGPVQKGKKQPTPGDGQRATLPTPVSRADPRLEKNIPRNPWKPASPSINLPMPVKIPMAHALPKPTHAQVHHTLSAHMVRRLHQWRSLPHLPCHMPASTGQHGAGVAGPAGATGSRRRLVVSSRPKIVVSSYRPNTTPSSAAPASRPGCHTTRKRFIGRSRAHLRELQP